MGGGRQRTAIAIMKSFLCFFWRRLTSSVLAPASPLAVDMAVAFTAVSLEILRHFLDRQHRRCQLSKTGLRPPLRHQAPVINGPARSPYGGVMQRNGHPVPRTARLLTRGTDYAFADLFADCCNSAWSHGTQPRE
jgi:hypothetical protein